MPARSPLQQVAAEVIPALPVTGTWAELSDASTGQGCPCKTYRVQSLQTALVAQADADESSRREGAHTSGVSLITVQHGAQPASAWLGPLACSDS